MAIPMFPEDECEHLSDNVFIHKHSALTHWKVWFRVGVSYFIIGGDYDWDKEEALYHAKFFVGALERFKRGEDSKGEE